MMVAIAPGAAASKAPPFLLPGEHFAAALGFALAGAYGLVAIAPLLARGIFLTPAVAGVTHLFTLGWITTSIMGALYQFLPVALGEPIRSVRLAHATFALYVPGLALFILGLLAGRSLFTVIGAATFGTGILLFLGNLVATLKRSRQRDVTWWALAGAAFFLFVTLLIGLALAGNLHWSYLGAGRLRAVGTHLHVAITGWVLLVMIGVGHRLLPMFLLSHGAREVYAKAAVALVASGAFMLAFLHHLPPLFSHWLPALLLAAGVLAFLLQARAFYAHRHRRDLDPGMRLAAAALALLALALLFSGPVVLASASMRLVTAYVLTALLGISLFVAAHYYKIVPFLVWYHRFGPLAGRQEVPRVAELYAQRIAAVAVALLALGAVGLAAGVLAGSGVGARAAAAVFAAGLSIEGAQMFGLWRKQP